jgi:hypothetical protein
MIFPSGLWDLRSIWADKRGVSNVIVFVLGLVIVVVIVADVFLWNYEMNQLDWERAQEDIKIVNVSSVNVTYSPWFTAQREYGLNIGNRVGGTYVGTQVADDGDWETFREEPRPPLHRLDLNGTFVLDASAFPLNSISTVEVRLRYMATDLHEDWFLEAYNWTAGAYGDGGFNVTVGHTPTGGWDTYAVNLTDTWRSYVRDDGTMYVKVRDEGNDAPQTTIDVDFLGVRAVAGGTRFLFENGGSVTCHLVSLWIVNSTLHRRYDMSVFVNSGETTYYLRADISLPTGQYMVKVVTERGNISVYSIE